MIFSFPVALSLPLPTSGLASEAKEGSFAFPKCHQFSRKLWEMSAVLLATLSGWGFSLVSLEKQVFGLRFPLGSFFRSSLREWVWPGRPGCWWVQSCFLEPGRNCLRGPSQLPGAFA